MKTLVLDLDETLIFSTLEPYTEGGVRLSASGQEFYTILRPGVLSFLSEMKSLFHCYVWSTGLPEYLKAVWDHLGVEGYTLWARDKCKRASEAETPGEHYEKPLTAINNDLSQVVIVDNTQFCFAKTPLNGISIKTWRGDALDEELEHLSYYLHWLSRQKSVQRNHLSWRLETLALRSALHSKVS